MNKDISQIPQGCYCYTPISVETSQERGYVVRTKLCPYWSKPGDNAVCSFIDYTDEFDFIDQLLLNDQCKLCGVNDEID